MHFVHTLQTHKRTEKEKAAPPKIFTALTAHGPHVVQTYAAPTDGEPRDATSWNNPNAAGRQDHGYRMFPVCPNEQRPGCGHTVSPCGPRPTARQGVSVPVRVANTY